MSGSKTYIREEPAKLFPHQEEFIQKFFTDSSNHAHHLQSEVGLGKSFTAVHLIKHLTEKMPEARILVLVPKPLQMQMQSLLSDIDVKAIAVDRYRYRELQDSAPTSDEIWTAGGVYLLSTNFAKSQDVAHSLASVRWSLLIVDEAHSLKGLGIQLVKQIVESSPNLKLLLISILNAENLPDLGIQLTSTHWTRSQIRDRFGKPMFDESPVSLELIEFQENETERRIKDSIYEFCKDLELSIPTTLKYEFLHSYSSSPASLEQRLRSFKNRLVQKKPYVRTDSIEDSENISQLTLFDMSSYDSSEKILPLLDKCLDALESLSFDSKLNAFVESVSKQNDISTASCIVTEYSATLFYLQAQLEEMGLDSLSFHGSMSYDDRWQNLHKFKSDGGILLATTAMMMEGPSLPHIQKLIWYDLPGNITTLEQVYGQFQRFGRKVPLAITVLVNSNGDITSDYSSMIEKIRRFCNV